MSSKNNFKFKWIHCGLLNLIKISCLLTLGMVLGSDWFLSLNRSRSFLCLELTLDSKYIFLITLVVVLCICVFVRDEKRSRRTCRSQLYSIKFPRKQHIFWYVGRHLYMLVYYFQNINLNWKWYWIDQNNSAISNKYITIKIKTQINIKNNVYVFHT